MSAIGKLARAPSLTVYANRDGSLWIRVDGRRQPLHGAQHWIKRDGRRMRGRAPLGAAPSRAPPPAHDDRSGSEDERSSGEDEGSEYDEDLALALALSMADAADAADAPAPAPIARDEPPPSSAAPAAAAPSAAAASTPSCAICMENIVPRGPPARGLPCGHSFHTARCAGFHGGGVTVSQRCVVPPTGLQWPTPYADSVS